MQNNGLCDSHKSAYPGDNSADIIPLKLHSDIAETLDKISMAALILLDLSAVFGATDHAKLLKGINGKYYLSNRVWSVLSIYILMPI